MARTSCPQCGHALTVPPVGDRARLKAERQQRFAELYRAGKTLQEIGTEFGITREYVRQILAAQGIKRSDGGKSVQTKKKRRARVERLAARRDARALRTFGCAYELARELNDGKRLSDQSGIACAFLRKRIHAKRANPDVVWTLTLPDFVAAWRESGLDRGLGSRTGAVVPIKRDLGYVPGNVQVVVFGDFVSAQRHSEWAARRAAVTEQALAS